LVDFSGEKLLFSLTFYIYYIRNSRLFQLLICSFQLISGAAVWTRYFFFLSLFHLTYILYKNFHTFSNFNKSEYAPSKFDFFCQISSSHGSYRNAAPSCDLKFEEARARTAAFLQLQSTFMGAAQLPFVRPATGRAQL